MSIANSNSTKSTAVTTVYLLLAFLSAFELFLVQPLIAKHILPWFGGAASVWTACLLFFQALLFFGYLYAYLISQTRIMTQVVCHITLIVLSLASLGWQHAIWGTPVTPPRAWAMALLEHDPTLAVVIILAMSVGLPYLLLSSTSPLVQSWFYGKDSSQKKPLYFFYAISNVGSLFALLVYPLLLEPLSGIRQQASMWGLGYVAFAIVCTACSLHALKMRSAIATRTEAKFPISRVWRKGLVWLGLSACATLMLISMTNQICANVAPVPLLWLLPLSLYLIAFIICFSSHAANIPVIAATIMLPVTGVLLYVMQHELKLGMIPQLATYLICLFCSCMLCLGMLHKQRPSPDLLTFFYLMIALGGAIGGLFVGIAAPILFSDYWELRIGLMFSCVLATTFLFDRAWMHSWRVPMLVATAAILFALSKMPEDGPTLTTVARSRSFYGALKVVEEEQARGVHVYSLMHGKICHGLQFDRGPFANIPNAYFGPRSGIGIAFANHPKRQSAETGVSPNMHVGVLGLGIGTVAAYGRDGDRFRFYELSPDVVDIATNTAHFRYLSACPADVELVIGDARLSMEQELEENGSHNFDILNMDAFNGDAIPVHLLTVEAFATYLAHLNPENGVLAIQNTNMYLDLVPVLAGIAKHYGLHGYVVEGTGDMRIMADCLWVLLSRDTAYAVSAPEGAIIRPLGAEDKDILWTDDFSNVITLMKTALLVKGKIPAKSEGHRGK